MNLSEEQIPKTEDSFSQSEVASQPESSQQEELLSEQAAVDNPQQEELLSEQAAVDNPQQEGSYKKAFDSFLADLESQSDGEMKLNKAIAFMEAALAQGGTPHFKSFWEARNVCIELFKQNINPASRAFLWAKYSDLSKEARRLKDILEEQSAFAAEQIEIAVAALENEIANSAEQLGHLPPFQFGIATKLSDNQLKTYAGIQQELLILNAQASRINALRKELIKTEMRIKQKNKFFQRLSQAGDKIFPRRKDLIREISQQFVQDIDAFIAAHFKGQEIQDSLFFLREEIKALQGMAKLLTLNTHAFTHTRMALSKCWDQVKEVEKERKKERAQQKVAFKENYDQLHNQIQAFCSTFAEGGVALADAQKKLDELVALMRQLELGRDELNALRDEMGAARQLIQQKQKEAEAEKQQIVLEKETMRRKSTQEFIDKCESLLAEADKLDADSLSLQREELLSKIAGASLSKGEKLDLEKRLKPLRDLIGEKKEQALLNLSDDDRDHLQRLKELLKEKRELRQEIKEQIEICRKSVNGSCLDFELSMSYNAQLAAEKERLEKINQGIREVESKIDEIESKS